MIARKLMEDMRKTDTVLLEINARDTANFETLVNGKRDTVVFIDDFLGKEYLDRWILKMWVYRFPLMEDMTRAGNVQFILTTRKDILEEGKSSLKYFEFFCKERIVDMTTFDLSGVKERMLMRHVEASSIFVLEDDSQTCFPTQLLQKKTITENQIKEISKIETPIGYPLCCYIFTTEKTWADEGKIFFQNPVLYIKRIIERLESEDKNRYCVLAVVLLCGGKASNYDISRNSNSEKFRSVLSKVSVTCEIQLQAATIARVSRILASSGTCLKSTDDGSFIFSHKAIEEAIALTYRVKGLKDIIELCPLRLLLEMVVANSNDAPGIIYNRERLENISQIELSILDFDMLVNRFVCEILDGNVWEVSQHKAFIDSKFLDRFFAIIQESGKIKEVITARQNIDLGGDLLFYAADNEVPKIELLERLLKFHSENQARKTNRPRRKLNCFSVPNGHNDYLEYAMSSALHTACRLGRKDIVDVLLRFDAKETPSLLSTAMQSQSVEIVQRLLQKYKWSEEQKKLALLEGCKHGNIELFELMVQSVEAKWEEGIFSKCLLESAKSGNVNLFEIILAKGCNVNYRGYFERCALHEACIGAHESLVTRLLRVPKININAMDKQGYTALHHAAEYNLLSIVELLLNAKAELEVSVRNDTPTVASSLPYGKKSRLTQKKQGISPYELASFRGHIDVCRMLKDAAYPRRRGLDYISTRL